MESSSVQEQEIMLDNNSSSNSSNSRNSNKENGVLEKRNICFIAHIDHGKTTLTDSLVKRAGLSNKEHALDHVRKEQVDRNITITATGAALFFDSLHVNLIDSPGHVDFSPEVSAALRLTDGCVVVVDVASGVKVQTQTVLKQALAERVRPVLVLNKLDRLFGEKQLNAEEVYTHCLGVVERVNGLLHIYGGENAPEPLDPQKGSVLFCSGKQGWGFSLPQLAARIAATSGRRESDVLKTLWGDVFFEEATGKWFNRAGAGRVRGFCKHVAQPIEALFRNDRNALAPFGFTVRPSHTGALLPVVLPAADALLECVRTQLPSPQAAQRYRASHLYTGPSDDRWATSIAACDPKGPLCVYICKCTPSANGNQFWAFGRILSGTVRRNMTVRILTGDDGQPSKTASVQAVAAPRGGEFQLLDECEAGNLVCLAGIDKFISRSATLVDEDATEAARVREMKFTVAPVVAVSVRPKSQADLEKFKKGLQKLAKVDQLVKVSRSEDNETIIAGAGELHMEILLGDLRRYAGVEIVVGKPVVALRETVVGSCAEPALAKSSNKHNRVFTTAAPLEEELVRAMDEVQIPNDVQERSALFQKHPEWNVDAKNPKRLWCLGGTPVEKETGANMLVDETHGVDYLNEAQSMFVTAFKRFALAGPLCGEPLHGVRVNVTHVKLHQDAAHRGAGELLEACRRSFSGAVATSEPRLMEPIMLATIECPNNKTGVVYNFVSKRRGRVVSETPMENGVPVSILAAHIPALECFGLDSALREASSGEAFPVLEFHHWQIVDGDPLQEGSFAWKLLKERRAQKNLTPEVDVTAFIDKL